MMKLEHPANRPFPMVFILCAGLLWGVGIGCTNQETVILNNGALECSYSAECPVGSFCSEGCCRIYNGCVSDAECGPTSTCLCDGLCYELVCAFDEDCPVGTSCSNGYCAASVTCSGSDQCPCGESCLEGTCQAGCSADADCCGEGTCIEGQCGQTSKPITCTNSTTCPSGSYCNMETQLCEALCQTDKDCPGGSACKENGLCYAICSASIACEGPNTFCDTSDGFCKQGQACEKDEDCPEGQFCGEGALCTLPATPEATP